ncbi:hypothetical protein AS25_03165 [Kocuria marina]|uniref:Uncharacterized protein n=1 Tax=Kocuria marina TaxID=223184 RepID=A0A0B0DHV5_9MICC|nr:hypothetical protein [Kocuria marina]KHE74834.1 hypothetical protein AS25_03165 [Kocuria marina]
MSAPAITPRTKYRALVAEELERFNATAVGDLNDLRHPSAYIHYINIHRFDNAVLEDREDFRAVCGFQWKQAPEVTELRNSLSPSDEFCPRCWVLVHRDLFGRWSR